MKAVRLQTLQEVMKTRGREIRKEPKDADEILDEMAGLVVQKELQQDMETARAIERIHGAQGTNATAMKNSSRKLSRRDENQKYARFRYKFDADGKIVGVRYN